MSRSGSVSFQTRLVVGLKDLVKYRSGTVCLIAMLAAAVLHQSVYFSAFFAGNLLIGAIIAFLGSALLVGASVVKDELLNGKYAVTLRIVIAVLFFYFGDVAEVHVTSVDAFNAATTLKWFVAAIVYVLSDSIGNKNLASHKRSLRYRRAKKINRSRDGGNNQPKTKKR